MSRPLAEILLDLDAALLARNDADKKLQYDTDDEDAQQEFDEADDKLDDLRDEFKDTFKKNNGVQWASVEAAQMSGAL